MFECHPRGRLLSTAFDYNLTKLEPTGFLFHRLLIQAFNVGLLCHSFHPARWMVKHHSLKTKAILVDHIIRQTHGATATTVFQNQI
jgi:hypothetical protein